METLSSKNSRTNEGYTAAMEKQREYCEPCDDWYEGVTDCFYIQQTKMCARHYREDRNEKHKKEEEELRKRALERGWYNIKLPEDKTKEVVIDTPEEIAKRVMPICRTCTTNPVEKMGHTMCRACRSAQSKAVWKEFNAKHAKKRAAWNAARRARKGASAGRNPRD